MLALGACTPGGMWDDVADPAPGVTSDDAAPSDAGARPEQEEIVVPHGEDLDPALAQPHVHRADVEAVDGPVTSQADGEVIAGLLVRVSGVGNVGIVVEHDDVIVRDVIVEHADGANGLRIEEGVRGTRVLRSSFDGGRSEHVGNFGSIGIVAYAPVHVHRSHFTEVRDGIHLYAGDSSVTESVVASLHHNPEAHNDGITFRGSHDGGGVLIARNRTVAGEGAGGITLFAERGPVQDVEVVDNLVIGLGVGFGLYGGYTHDHRAENRDIRIVGNRFVDDFGFPEVLGGGTNAAVNLDQPGNEFQDNRWNRLIGALPARCGELQDEC